MLSQHSLDYHTHSSAGTPSAQTWFKWLVVAGFVFRLALSWVSYGSDDAWIFHMHGWAYNEFGFREPYEFQKVQYNPLNHPPLPVLYAAWCDRVHETLHVRFQFLFRLPMIAIDGFAALVLFRSWRHRNPRKAQVATLAWVWSPLAILTSAYHCNTDGAVASLLLVSVSLLAGGRAFWAGLMLAAAANIKIVPLLAIPLLATACRNGPAVVRFGIGIALGLTPFYIAAMVGGEPFIKGVFGYAGFPGQWGPALILLEAQKLPNWSDGVNWAFVQFQTYGRWLLIFVMNGLALLSAYFIYRGRRWNAWELGAVAMTAFLVFAPSFAVQYTIYPLPLLLAVCVRRGVVYGVLGGLLTGITYAAYITYWYPLQSQFKPGIPPPALLFGFAAWVTLCGVLFDLIKGQWKKRNSPADASADSERFALHS